MINKNTIEYKWQQYKKKHLHFDAPEEILLEFKKAFYAGIISLNELSNEMCNFTNVEEERKKMVSEWGQEIGNFIGHIEDMQKGAA